MMFTYYPLLKSSARCYGVLMACAHSFFPGTFWATVHLRNKLIAEESGLNLRQRAEACSGTRFGAYLGIYLVSGDGKKDLLHMGLYG